MIIYLDMDDVVADWLAYAKSYLNLDWDPSKGERIPLDQWDRLKQLDRLYLNLELKPGATELVNWCTNYRKQRPNKCSGVRFLTAIPHDFSVPFAAQDKVWWAHKYFPGVPVFFGPFSHDKWRHCQPGDILIDDRVSNCTEWTAAGGRAHVYTNWQNCQSWLEENLN